MVSEVDLDRTAPVLVHDHGAASPIRAAMKHDALLDRRDAGRPAETLLACPVSA